MGRRSRSAAERDPREPRRQRVVEEQVRREQELGGEGRERVDERRDRVREADPGTKRAHQQDHAESGEREVQRVGEPLDQPRLRPQSAERGLEGSGRRGEEEVRDRLAEAALVVPQVGVSRQVLLGRRDVLEPRVGDVAARAGCSASRGGRARRTRSPVPSSARRADLDAARDLAAGSPTPLARGLRARVERRRRRGRSSVTIARVARRGRGRRRRRRSHECRAAASIAPA